MNRYLTAFLLTAALAVPMTARADDRHDDHHANKRYYDRQAKDWHEWNENETRAYRRYLEERHRTYHEWEKAKRLEQEDYWRWRHAHPDSSLFRPEVR